MSAAGVKVSTASFQGARAGSSPSAALHSIQVKPIPFTAAKAIVERNHYLHSMPGGTCLSFGAFVGPSLLGALILGRGPRNSATLVAGAEARDCLTLTRLWLSDDLPRNSESRVIAVVLRSLRQHTSIKFVLSYADPSQGHLGTIYQATDWLYTGPSQAVPLYDLGDGVYRHSRSLGHSFGSRSVAYLERQGMPVKLIPQAAKHKYVYFLVRAWQERLLVPVLPYPKKGCDMNGSH